MRRNTLVRAARAAIEWLDAVVLFLLLAAGTALVLVAIVGDASAVQVGLIALLTAFFALRWIQTSYAWEKLRSGDD